MTRSTSESSVERARASAEKISASLTALEDAVAAIQSGDDWRQYLEMQSRLHAYSANNVLLIATQHARAFAEGRVSTPEPSYVAGFATWKALGRVVDKGQRSYAILAPLRARVRVATQPTGEERVLEGSETPVPGEELETRGSLRGFGIEHVFALEQTSGVALPVPPAPSLLTGCAPPGLVDAVTALVTTRGFSVSPVADTAAIDGANGRTDYTRRTVVVRGDVDEAQRAKTLLHEAAHVLLHDPARGESVGSRAVCEVEAESVAFVVASAHGLSTNDYSFPYVATWAGTGGSAVVRARANRVAGAAREIIAASSSPHSSGGRPPGAEVALGAAQMRRPQLARVAGPRKDPEPALVGERATSVTL